MHPRGGYISQRHRGREDGPDDQRTVPELGHISALIGVASSIGIVAYLQRRGQRINWIFINVFILKYVHQYHGLTTQETGKPGPLFYSYVIAMNTALVAAIIGMALR
jgi:hypothetical protein